MPVTVVKSEAEFDSYLKKSKDDQTVLVVDFSATWCGPCRMIEPRVHAMSETYTSVTFIQVDVDDLPNVSSRCGVTAMPTFHIYKAGEKVDDLVGANADALKDLIVKHSA